MHFGFYDINYTSDFMLYNFIHNSILLLLLIIIDDYNYNCYY